MGSIHLRIESSLYLGVLKDALSSVIDIESDMCLDEHTAVRVDNKINEEALGNLVDLYGRVKYAKEALERLKAVDDDKLPTSFFVTTPVLEILERGLQVHVDILSDSVTEPFHHIKAYDGIIAFSNEAFELLRKKIEDNVDKLVAAKDLHAIVSRV